MPERKKIISQGVVSNMEVYLHRLTIWHADKRRWRPIKTNKKKEILDEIRRIQTFIEYYDLITGGRGTIYMARNVDKNRVAHPQIMRFGCLDVARRVTGIDTSSISKAAIGKRSHAGKWAWSRFPYQGGGKIVKSKTEYKPPWEE